MSADAIDHAKQALIIQSGLQKIAEQAGNYYQNKAMRIVRQYNLEPEVGIIGLGYRVYKTKTFRFKFLNKNISLSPDIINKTYSMGVSWSW